MKKKNWRPIAVGIAFVLIVILFIAMFFQNSYYNSRVHTLNFSSSIAEEGLIADDNLALRLCIRGYDEKEYASWIYRLQNPEAASTSESEAMVGAIYELSVKNLSQNTVSSWEADIYFPEEVYLNSGWNGTFILHQNVASQPKEHTFADGKFDMKNLELDYIFDGVCLLIKMNAGDYITYLPSAEYQEVPLAGTLQDGSNNIEKRIGFIAYSPQSDTSRLIPFSSGAVRYTMHRDLIDEPGFIPFFAALLIWIIVFSNMITVHIRLQRLSRQNELLAQENEKVRAENRQFIAELEAAK